MTAAGRRGPHDPPRGPPSLNPNLRTTVLSQTAQKNEAIAPLTGQNTPIKLSEKQ